MEKLLTVEDVASILQVTEETVKRFLRKEEMKGHKIGRLWRVKEEDLESFIKRR